MHQSTLAMLSHGYAVSITVIGGTEDEVEELIDGLIFSASREIVDDHGQSAEAASEVSSRFTTSFTKPGQDRFQKTAKADERGLPRVDFKRLPDVRL